MKFRRIQWVASNTSIAFTNFRYSFTLYKVVSRYGKAWFLRARADGRIEYSFGIYCDIHSNHIIDFFKDIFGNKSIEEVRRVFDRPV